MRVFQVFAFIWLLNLSSSSDGQINRQSEIVLNNPLENFPLKNMEIDLEAKIVYVSGKNILYRLSVEEDMQMIKRQTGPDVNCLPMLSPEELKEYCGDDYNTVMVVTPDSLITCGTLRGGLCMRRDKESLNTTFTSPNVRLVSRDQASAVGIYLNINDTSSSQQLKNIILFAKRYTTLPLVPHNLDKTAIFSALPDLSALNIGSSKYGKIFDMIIGTRVVGVMDYRVAIENDNFVFFLLNQNSQSKLVKICKSVDSEDPKKVYEDIPLFCYSMGTNLTHVKHGIFIFVSGKRYLVGLFSSSKPTLSAVCVFEEKEIYQTFLKAREHRYICPKNDLPFKDKIFQNDETPKICITRNQSVSFFYDAFHRGDYCNDETGTLQQFGIIVGLLPLGGTAVYSTKSHGFTVVGSSTVNNLASLYIRTDKGYVIQSVSFFYDAFHRGDYCNDETGTLQQFGIIVGLLPLGGTAVYSTKSHGFTVVGSSTVNNLASLYIGTDKGYVIQLLYDTEKNETSVLAELKVDSSEIRAIRSVNKKTYIMSQHKIVKLTPKKNCEHYSRSCQECMDVYDFDCG